MIQEYVFKIAAQIGTPISQVSVVEGRSVGCLGVYLLHMYAGSHQASALAYQSELDDLRSSGNCGRLDVKIRDTLSRLQLLLEP
jgi:hypothetical protein